MNMSQLRFMSLDIHHSRRSVLQHSLLAALLRALCRWLSELRVGLSLVLRRQSGKLKLFRL